MGSSWHGAGGRTDGVIITREVSGGQALVANELSSCTSFAPLVTNLPAPGSLKVVMRPTDTMHTLLLQLVIVLLVIVVKALRMYNYKRAFDH